jgi:GWxTD domain-containing protein
MRVLGVFLLLLNVNLSAQSLRDINYSYLYSAQEPFNFSLKPVRSTTAWTVLYRLTLRDTVYNSTDYSIQWEVREGLNTRDGDDISTDRVKPHPSPRWMTEGEIQVDLSSSVQFLVAKVKKEEKVWYFYTALEPKYPVTGVLTANSVFVDNGFIDLESTATASSEKTLYVAYYNDVFPPATPAFSESAAKVPAQLRVDSSWSVEPGQVITFPKKGLYLFQEDTLTAEGFTIRAEDDYPRLGKVESLADPLTYICTSQELGRVRQAKGDKKAFDRVILSITMDQDRARRFMKSYYRRVEVANQLFTSYKEGWKTDRGMIYIIFGPPNQVFKTAERELWYYKNSSYKIDFEFTKSPTLFDPDNYVLLREKKFEPTVYEVIDLWRNARF